MSKVEHHRHRLMNEHEVAERLGVSPGTLRVWRCTKRHNLPFIKLGKSVRYDVAAVEQFITASTITPASVA